MDQVSQIREKIDLVSLIAEYIPLKKAGRNFKAVCPFHNEKTPSFVVSPERQIWHCFGCGKGGDCYTFLMEYESLEFPEALRMLAKKSGIELRESSWQSGTSFKKEKIYKLNSLAMEFYHYLLIKHNVGKKALDYLVRQRGIKIGVINTFKLGFSPRLGSALSDYLLKKKKYKKEELIDAGLANQKGVFDFFVNRIIFPLIDHRGNIVGFSGRVMEDSTALGQKYVNTRETLVYHKGDVFFGLNMAKEDIKKENCAIVTEGEFDVMSSFQAGIKNVVAVKGTALTDNQVNLLSRFTQKVGLCFDMDKAGNEAIRRSLSVLEKKGLTTTVIVLQNGKDPDESIKKDPLSFQKAVKNDVGIYDFLFSQAFLLFDKKTVEGKKKIGDELLPIFVGIENEIIKEHYLKQLAAELDTSYESIIKQMQRIKENAFILAQQPAVKGKKTREEVLEEYLLALILQADNLSVVLERTIKMLSGFLPKISAYEKILENLFSQQPHDLNIKKFSQNLPSELLPSFNTSFLFPLPNFENENFYLEEVEKVLKELKALYLRSKIKAVTERIKDKEKEEEALELENLKKEFSYLVSLFQKSQSTP